MSKDSVDDRSNRRLVNQESFRREVLHTVLEPTLNRTSGGYRPQQERIVANDMEHDAVSTESDCEGIVIRT